MAGIRLDFDILTHGTIKMIKRILVIALLVFSQLSYAGNAVHGNFVLKDMSGIKHQLSNYKGKWVLVNYWATWCAPCLEEVPDLVNLYDHRKKKDLMILGVVFDYQSTKDVTDYVDDMLMSYPIILGDDDVVEQIGSADVLPTTFIYNPKGELVKIKKGMVTREYLEKIIGNGNPS